MSHCLSSLAVVMIFATDLLSLSVSTPQEALSKLLHLRHQCRELMRCWKCVISAFATVSVSVCQQDFSKVIDALFES